MVLALSAGFAEDAPKKEKASPAAGSRAYEPLVIPDKQGGGATPVPSAQKELPKDGDKQIEAVVGPETSSGGGIVIPIEAQKDKKQQLWIYTLPEEETALRKQQEEEARQMERPEDALKARQLPSWAIDPEFRKYFLTPDAGSNPSQPGAASTDWNFFGPIQGQGAQKEPGTPAAGGWPSLVPVQGALPVAGSTGSLFPGGTSLTTGKDTTKAPPEMDLSAKPASEGTDYDALYQSNQKQKRIEDFHDGLNKPVETEKSSDRYHKPQKPQ